MKTKKIKLTLDPLDAAVVAPIEFWDHLITTYKELAKQDEESAEYWLEAVDFVRGWIEDTFYSPEDEGEDWDKD